MTKELRHIGSKELISFPEMDVLDVPAKVDTGADFSSIWASDISEEGGALTFTLFAPGSPYYTGERVRTEDYTVAYIRNSFGQTQQRYKVKVLMRIRSKRVRVEVTLADRSSNRYPVLIGKATLRGRFAVDVGKNGMFRGKKIVRVLVMNSKNSPAAQAFFDEMTASEEGLMCDFATYDMIRFDIIDGKSTCSILGHETKLSDYDLIYFKTYFQYAEIAAAMTEVAKAQDVAFIDQEVANYHAKTKLTQYLRLARHGVPVPDSIIMPSGQLENAYDELHETFGERFVMKDVAADKGERNYVVSSRKEFDEIASDAAQNHIVYVTQRFIENDGDYRVITLGKKVEMVIGRTVRDTTTHLTNTSKGGVAQIIATDSFGSEPSTIAVRAAAAMSRQVAGVDLVFDKAAKKWLVFEVNNGPQLVSGSYVKEKQAVMSRFLRTYAKKK